MFTSHCKLLNYVMEFLNFGDMEIHSCITHEVIEMWKFTLEKELLSYVHTEKLPALNKRSMETAEIKIY